MRHLTHSEKHGLETKIEEEKERQQTLREMSPNTPEDSIEVSVVTRFTSSVTRFTSSYLWKYGFLAFILCLLVYNLFILFKFRNFGYDQYGLPMITLMLLFNHIAYYITMKGRKSIVMKTVAWAWIVLVLVYLFWIT